MVTIVVMLSLGFSLCFAIILSQFILKISQFNEIYKGFGHKKNFFFLLFLYFLILILIFSFLRYESKSVIKEQKTQSNIEKELREKIEKQIQEHNKKVEEENWKKKMGKN